MLTASVKHYKRTLENIHNRYDSLVNLSKTLDLANRMANDILDGLPKEEQDRLKNSNLKLLNAIVKGMNKYEIIITNLHRAFELANKRKLITMKVTEHKIILDYRKLNGATKKN